MQSLLRILKAEDALIEKINDAEIDAAFYRRKCDGLRNIPIVCEARSAEIAYCEDKIIRCQLDIEECERDLDIVRAELKEYLTELLK